jgi:hypothetical protein
MECYILYIYTAAVQIAESQCMAPELSFNPLALRRAFHKRLLVVKPGSDVSGSLDPVTALTAPGEVSPYAPHIPRIALGTRRGPW